MSNKQWYNYRFPILFNIFQ